MKLSLPRVGLLALSALFFASSLSADVVTEATIGSGYRSNLFNDSNVTGDTYGSARVDLKYYPSAFAQLAAGAQYDVFAEHSALSNLTGDVSIAVIPTPEVSRFSAVLAGNLAIRRFGTLYELYDQIGATAGIDMSYRLALWAHLQSSAFYSSTVYSNSDYGSNRGFDIATGINFTILGSNSLALTAEYSRRSFDQALPIQQSAGHNLVVDQDKSETFEVTGFLVRYSRPLGERTGMSFSVGHRQLHVENDYTVLGYTIDYLSPWADLWEGLNFSVGMKHFFPKQITTELTFGYLDKSFVDVIELGEVISDTYWQDTRDDQLTSLLFSISRPVSLQNGKQFTPLMQLGYRKNQSSSGFFDYSDISASISLRMTI